MTLSNVYIITGDQGTGKTTFLSTFSGQLKKNGIKSGGILARGVWENNIRTGFVLEGINSGQGKSTTPDYVCLSQDGLPLTIARTAQRLSSASRGPCSGLGWLCTSAVPP